MVIRCWRSEVEAPNIKSADLDMMPRSSSFLFGGGLDIKRKCIGEKEHIDRRSIETILNST